MSARWHAWEPEHVRHSALDCSCIYFGEDHMLHLLFWMINVWPDNPNLEHYSDVVKSDYNWFDTERNSTAYGGAKRELIQELKHEFYSLNAPNSLQNIFGSYGEIDHWFIIIG